MKKTNLIALSKKHFEAVIQKNIEEILDSYSTSENLLVFVEGPRWATLGYENVSKGWTDFVESPISLKKCVWLENPEAKVNNTMGFVAGIVKLTVEINEKIQTIKFRGTFVFEKDAEENWKIIHEHFSQPAQDPYGIGDWLKEN